MSASVTVAEKTGAFDVRLCRKVAKELALQVRTIGAQVHICTSEQGSFSICQFEASMRMTLHMSREGKIVRAESCAYQMRNRIWCELGVVKLNKYSDLLRDASYFTTNCCMGMLQYLRMYLRTKQHLTIVSDVSDNRCHCIAIAALPKLPDLKNYPVDNLGRPSATQLSFVVPATVITRT